MNPLRILTLLAFLGLGLAKKDYTGYKVLRFQPKTREQLMKIDGLSKFHVDFWTSISTHIPVDIAVPPDVMKNVTNVLDKESLNYDFLIEDLEGVINEEVEENAYARYRSRPMFRTGGFRNLNSILSYYARHGEINQWLESVARKYPRLASTYSIGRSHEGRDTRVLKLTSGSSGTKPVIWLDSAIHAREWISASTNLFIIYQLVNGYESGETRSLLDNYEWHILPVCNPDGYEHTHDENRLWRKTRRQHGSRGCYGVDPNRNFGYHWAERGAMSSPDPCSDIYHGPNSFSEVETRNMRDAMLKFKNRFKIYLSFHSYSQMLFVPWGYSRYVRPSNYNELYRVATAMQNSIYNVYRKYYQVGSPAEILYAAGGGSYDWAHGMSGAQYAFTFELRPSQYTSNGFILPPSQIAPTGTEIWAGVKTMVNEVR